jgi:replicative DNA helicase
MSSKRSDESAVSELLDHERHILGVMIIAPEQIGELQEAGLKPAHFLRGGHQVLCDALYGMHQAGKAITAPLLLDWLKKKKLHESVSEGPERPAFVVIHDLVAGFVTAAHVVHECTLVVEAGRRRALVLAAEKLVTASRDQSMDLDAVLDAFDAAATDGRAAHQQTCTNMVQAIQACFNNLDNHAVRTIRTGIDHLDNLTGGLHCGELTVVAARPGVGKTTLGLNMAYRVALHGQKVLFFSFEQSAADLAVKMLSMASGVPQDRVRHGKLSSEHLDAFHAAAEQLGALPLILSSDFTTTISRLCSLARWQVRRAGVRVVVVDYLGLIGVDQTDARRQRYEQVQNMTRRLKVLSGELDVPVVVLAQLNREIERRNDPKPRLSDLRESGSLEQDGDVVMLLWHQDDDTSRLSVRVAKQRNGPVGEFCLEMDYKTGRIVEPVIDDPWS